MNTTSFSPDRTDPSDQVSTAPGAFHLGGALLAVAHHLRDLSQRRARPQHHAGGGVPQLMRRHARHPGPRARLAQQTTNHVSGDRRRTLDHRQEHRSVLAGRPIAQIVDQRLADIHRQRQTITTPTFAVDQHLARPPVQIIKPQPRHFTGPQPEPDQHQHDRVVTPADQPPAITAGQQRDDRFGRTPRASARPRTGATAGTAHSSGAAITPARCR
jgi:hypothetical protein